MENNGYIDVNDGLKRVGGNAKLYARLLSSYVANPRETELLSAIEAGDTSAAAQAAHAIKGVAANLSLTTLRDFMAVLEQSLKSGSPHANAGEIKKCISSTLLSIEEALKELGS